MAISGNRIKILLFSSLFLFFSTSSLAYGLNVGDVSKEFICNCGCGKLLSECEMECGKTLRKAISAKIEEGLTKDRIIEYMMDTYGETLLAAPTKKGFNLTAWTTPFLAIFLGGFLIALILIRWTKKHTDNQEKLQQKRDKEFLNDKYLERFEKEMREIEG